MEHAISQQKKKIKINNNNNNNKITHENQKHSR